MMEIPFENQVKKGNRFQFGKNWEGYLGTISEEKIHNAEKSLMEMLECNDMTGKHFLDVGCGSGLFSLAAMRMGAYVFSFDFDPDSVKCAQLLREKFFSGGNWKIEKGSILDKQYVSSLGQFDIVYSWGVLHHTGDMEGAMRNIDFLVKNDGKLFIAIYNDEGKNSVRWRKIKKIYNSGALGRYFIVSIYFPFFFFRSFFSDILKFKNPFRRYYDYKSQRGMSMFYDWLDWLGGLPFEVATPDAIFEFFKQRGYTLQKLKTTQTLGCNEFVFQKTGK